MGILFNVKKEEPVKAPVVEGTTALRVEELNVGLHYKCLLSELNVMYIGGKIIKWYCTDAFQYKYDEVHDYQLVPKV